MFQDWHCEVTALELERTFWEKATILHADFARLLAHPRANTFLADSAMCLRVAEWKSQVFSRKWARYELARPGSFRLVPPEPRMKDLEKDYVAMRPMFLTEPQTFSELIRVLTDAEQQINGN